MGAAVVPHRGAAPILEATEHDLDLVALFVKVVAIATLFLAVFLRRTTGRNLLLLQGRISLSASYPRSATRWGVRGRPGAGALRRCSRSSARRSRIAAPACRCRRRRRAASNSTRLSYGQYSGGAPFFEPAGRRSVSFQMRGIDHQAVSHPLWV